MKFRILEKRGKFRIEKCERIIKYDKPLRFGVWAKCSETHLTWGKWELIKSDKIRTVKAFDCFCGVYETHVKDPAEFDTYKQAVNYIKKHYGLEGVKAIEEPEWRQV